MTDQSRPSPVPVPIWQQILAWAVGPGWVMALDAEHWWAVGPGGRTWQTFLFGLGTGWWWFWLALLPVALALGSRDPLARLRPRWLRSPVACFLLCFGLAIAITAGNGWHVRDLPPLYHDEYSYRFQAQTFLAGRLAFPEPEFASLFDQMHVLHSGVFASRYFPGVGLWLAPFEWTGAPVAGWWLANGLIAGFVALAGHRFSPIAGYAAGCLAACSPAMVALGNLTLSPQPTMLGFAIFLWAYPAIFPRNGTRKSSDDKGLPESEALRLLPPAGGYHWPLLAGLGIGYAFLCRPLTAAGLGLPYALYSLYRARFGVTPGYAGRLAVLIASFSVSILAMGIHNRAVTGSAFVTPYGVYTASRTPKHVYGFYNRTRGAARPTDEVLRAYDEWSDNLTVPLAWELLVKRSMGLVRWSAGIPMVAWLGMLALVQLARGDDRVLLLALSILGLAVAYTPFAFAGLLGWGYLFEAMVPLFVLLGWALGRLCEGAAAAGRALCQWWFGLFAIMLGSTVFQSLPELFTPGSELVAPRLIAREWADREHKAAHAGPILVIVDSDPRDSLHTTYVYNRPTLDGPVLRIWNRGADAARFADAHPDRAVYLFQPSIGDRPPHWRLLRPARRSTQ